MWEGLQACCIDVYQGPPERIVHDAGKNFASDGFKQNVGTLAFGVKEVPAEAQFSIGKVDRYHGSLRGAYEIIQIDSLSSLDIILQMALEVVNNTACPNDLVPTILVFGSYRRILSDQPAVTLNIKQRAMTILKSIK